MSKLHNDCRGILMAHKNSSLDVIKRAEIQIAQYRNSMEYWEEQKKAHQDLISFYDKGIKECSES